MSSDQKHRVGCICIFCPPTKPLIRKKRYTKAEVEQMLAKSSLKERATDVVFGVEVPNLSLLVIDLGDACIIRVEQGSFSLECEPYGILYKGDTSLARRTFTKLRAAIDGEKPTPRIEQHPQIKERHYLHYFWDGNGCMPLTAQQYDDLTEINGGVPLPIYEPTGRWEQILDSSCFDTKKGLPNIYRYSRN